MIVISATPLDAPVRSPACGDVVLREELRVVVVGDVRYAVSASAPEAEWVALEGEVGRIVASMRSS